MDLEQYVVKYTWLRWREMCEDPYGENEDVPLSFQIWEEDLWKVGRDDAQWNMIMEAGDIACELLEDVYDEWHLRVAINKWKRQHKAVSLRPPRAKKR